MRSLPRACSPICVFVLLCTAAVLFGSVLTPRAHAGSSLRVVRDLQVPTTGGARIAIDVWQVGSKRRDRARRPAPQHLRKVAVLVHGGGWHSGDKRQWEQSRWAQRLVANGWIVVNANYRLACTVPVSRKERARRDARMCGHAMRDSIADVRNALRYTARHAHSWGGDPQRIVLFGASAGGQLAMLAGSDHDRPKGVRAVVAIGPPTDLTWVGQQPDLPIYASARQSIGCELQACPATWRRSSPISRIRPGVTPPTWIFNANSDPITSITPIRSYMSQLQHSGVPVELVSPLDPGATCHGPIPCAAEPLAGPGSDMFLRALAWLRPYV